MTAIAYRSGVMAGDTLSTFSYISAHETKVIKRDGWLIGVSGESCPSNDDLSDWVFNNIKAKRLPKFDGMEFELLAVRPSGRMYLYYSSGIVYPVPHLKFWAVGSGAEVCMGAMEMGASAEQAVRAAIKWQKACGGRVITKKLKGK